MTITKGTPSPSPTPTPSTTSDAQAQALQQFLAGATSGTTTGTGKVFMGMTNPGAGSVSSFAPTGATGQKKVSKPHWMSTDDATAQYFNWSQKARDDFRAKGLLSGLLTAGAGDLEAYSLWQGLVNQSALYGSQNKQVSPLDILGGYVKGNSNGGWVKNGDFETNPVTGEKRYIGPQFKTTTQNQVDLTDPATARAIAVKQFQSLLGRDPGQGEISAYANALSQSEQSNPSSATTTTQYDMTTGEAVGSNTVTSGGLTADAQAQLAADEVKKKKEYGATQAATTYMNALDSAVGL
jgi:hypothetical protein